MRKWIRALSAILVVLLVAAIGLFIWLYTTYKDIRSNPLSVFEEAEKYHGTVVDDESNTHVQTKGIVNLLLLGIDSNEERVQQHKGYRSDVMIVCALDFDKKEMSMLSIPRDTRTEMNKLDYETGEVTERTTNKINAAYAFGGGPNYFGAENAMDCIEDFISCDGRYDVPINYYVSIDMDGLPLLADAVGGVDVVLDRDLPGIGSEGETVTITSENIDDYVRNRKDGGGGDDGRASRQVDFLMAFAKKVQKMGAVNAAPALYDKIIQFTQTNLTLDQVLGMASFLDSMEDIDNSLTRHRVTGEGGYVGKTWYYNADMEDVSSYILETYYDPE